MTSCVFQFPLSNRAERANPSKRGDKHIYKRYNTKIPRDTKRQYHLIDCLNNQGIIVYR